MDKDKLSKIEDKIDKINEKLGEIHVTLSENTHSLIIHEKRTDLAERKLQLLELELKEKSDQSDKNILKLNEKIEPISHHVAVVSIVIKYILPAIITGLAFLYKFDIFKF